MLDQSIAPSASTLRQPQSITAVLPQEIIEYIFEFVYAGELLIPRDEALSSLSAVTPHWTAPARKLLFRDVRIRSWLHFNELVAMDTTLMVVRTLRVNFGKCGSRGWQAGTDGRDPLALFQLLQKTPNLVELDLMGSSFSSFLPTDSIIMRTSHLLPHLTRLNIITHDVPLPIIHDLLASSNQRISRLSCTDFPIIGVLPRPAPFDPLDFGGNLRFLSTEGTLNRSLLDPSRVLLSSLVGLEMLALGVDSRGVPCSRMKGVFDVVAGSLRKLCITGGADDVAQDIGSLIRLTHLTIDSVLGSLTALRYLPASLCFLFLNSDAGIAPYLESWKETPGTVPPNLKHLSIGIIHHEQTWNQLPRIEKLTVYWNSDVERILKSFTVESVPFRVLQVKFRRFAQVAQLEGTKFECGRLGVELILRKPDGA